MARKRTSCKYCKDAHVRCDGSDPNCHKYAQNEMRQGDVGRRLPFFTLRRPFSFSSYHTSNGSGVPVLPGGSSRPSVGSVDETSIGTASGPDGSTWGTFSQGSSQGTGRGALSPAGTYYIEGREVACHRCDNWDREGGFGSKGGQSAAATIGHRLHAPRRLLRPRQLLKGKQHMSVARASAPAAIESEDIDMGGAPMGRWAPMDVAYRVPHSPVPYLSQAPSPASAHSVRTGAMMGAQTSHSGGGYMSVHQPEMHAPGHERPLPLEREMHLRLRGEDSSMPATYPISGARDSVEAEKPLADHSASDPTGLVTWLPLSIPLGIGSRHSTVKPKARASAPARVEPSEDTSPPLAHSDARHETAGAFWTRDRLPDWQQDNGPTCNLPQAMEGMSLQGRTQEGAEYYEHADYGSGGVQRNGPIDGQRTEDPVYQQPRDEKSDHAGPPPSHGSNDVRFFRPFQDPPWGETYHYGQTSKQDGRSHPYQMGRSFIHPRSPVRAHNTMPGYYGTDAMASHVGDAHDMHAMEISGPQPYAERDSEYGHRHAATPPPRRSWPRFPDIKAFSGTVPSHMARRDRLPPSRLTYQPSAPTIVETLCDDNTSEGVAQPWSSVGTQWSQEEGDAPIPQCETTKRSAYQTMFGWLAMGNRAPS